MAQRRDESGKFIQEQAADIKDIAKNIADENKKSQVSLDILTAGNKINELAIKGSSAETDKMLDTFYAIKEKLINANENTKAGQKTIATALTNLENLQNEANALEATRELTQQASAGEMTQGLSRLTDQIKVDNNQLKAQINMNELSEKLEKLNTGQNRLYDNAETREKLAANFLTAQTQLNKAIEEGDIQGIEIAQKQLEAVQAGAESEEERRESAKVLEAQNSYLEQTANGIAEFGGKFDNMAKGLLSGGGFLAGLAAVALAIFDPETLQNVIQSAIEGITEIVNGIQLLISGDIEGAMGLFGDNIGMISGIIGVLALQFGGAIFAKLAGLLKGVRAVMIGLRVFRIFMMTTFIPSMIAAFSGMMAAITPILAALAPILLPILAIAAVFGLIYVALEKMRESLGFTSIFDVLMLGVMHMKDAFGHVVNLIGSIVNFILGMVEKFGRFLGFEIDLPEIPKMDTDSAEKFKAQKQLEASLAAEEEKNKAPADDLQLEPAVPNMDGNTLNAMSTENAQMAVPQQVAPTVNQQVQNVQGNTNTSNVTNVTSRRKRRGYYLNSDTAALQW